VVGAATALAADAARAEEPGGEVPILSAADFLARVERASPAMELLDSEIDAEAAAATAAGMWANPSLSYGREEIFAGGRGYAESTIEVELPLEISGRRGLRVEAADRAKREYLLDALGVYLRAAAARQKLDGPKAERAALGRLVAAATSRTAAGDTSGYDLDRLTLEADALDDLIADGERELAAYQRTLALLAGEPASRLDADDALELPADPAGATGAPALAAHPAHRAATLRVQQAETELRAAGRGWVPSLGVTGGAKRGLVDVDPRWGYVVGLSLNLPLLDRGQADRAHARARLRAARAEQRLLEQQLLARVALGEETLARTVTQARRFEQTQLPRLDQLVRRAEVSYQEGERPVFELLDAYRTARAIRLRVVELRLAARLAEIELWRALGMAPGGTP
jgi:cobalt-zinc-cadmium efflux system outer membrane protein